MLKSGACLNGFLNRCTPVGMDAHIVGVLCIRRAVAIRRRSMSVHLFDARSVDPGTEGGGLGSGR